MVENQCLLLSCRNYNIAMEFNSTGMYRAAADHAGRFEIAIF